MVKVNLHGRLGKEIGEKWELDVSSVSEALRAIEANTGKFRKWILSKNQNYLEYAILINKKPLDFANQPTLQNMKDTEIYANFGNKLQSIDIIPVIAGSGGGGGFMKIITIFVGAAVLAASFFAGPLAPFVALAGLSLIAAGVTSLLAKPPPLLPFNAQQATTQNQGAIGQGGGPQSYLFNGPVNTVGEGGPVPVGYGTLMVGSVAVNVYYENVYVANLRQTDTNTGSMTFTQDTIYGKQFYYNEDMMLTSQSSSYLNTV
jgi:predicted phage tail protein